MEVDGSRSVSLDVEPHLLQDLLARLLQAAGWIVQPQDQPDVVVRSSNPSSGTQDGSALTIVLPDDGGTGGQVRRAGWPDEPLLVGPGILETVLAVLGPSHAT